MLSDKHIEQIKMYFSDNPILKAWMFGSYARGENKADSDVDLLVRPDYAQKPGIGFFSIQPDLEKILGRGVDVVSEGYFKDFARTSVERDKKLIYERV